MLLVSYAQPKRTYKAELTVCASLLRIDQKEPSYPARILTSQKAHACCCFYVVKTKEAPDYHPLGDHAYPSGKTHT